MSKSKTTSRSLKRVGRSVHWHCENCNRTGSVKVELDEQLHRMCSRIFDAHNNNWHCMCPDWAVHVNI